MEQLALVTLSENKNRLQRDSKVLRITTKEIIVILQSKTPKNDNQHDLVSTGGVHSAARGLCFCCSASQQAHD